MSAPDEDVAVLLGLAGRRVCLSSTSGDTLQEGLASAGAGPPLGRAWSVVRGTEPVELSTPLSQLAGQELSAVLVSELLDWCEVDTGLSEPRPFAVCGLLRPGDEVLCLATEEGLERRTRLPERAERLVQVSLVGVSRCVHAVTAAGRSMCIGCSGYRPEAFGCVFATVFRGADAHGGPSSFAATRKLALLLCADGSLLCSRSSNTGAWQGAEQVAGRFLQVAAEASDDAPCRAAALREDGEVLLWSCVGVLFSGGRAARLCVSQRNHYHIPRWLLAADELGALRSLAAEALRPKLDDLFDRLRALALPRGGCVAVGTMCSQSVPSSTSSYVSTAWPLAVALAGDGSVVVCRFGAHGRQKKLAASLQARLDAALRGRRCERMICLRDRVVLLLAGGEAEVLDVDQELPPTRLPEGEVEDVLEAVFGALLRFADGRRVWLEAERPAAPVANVRQPKGFHNSDAHQSCSFPRTEAPVSWISQL